MHERRAGRFPAGPGGFAPRPGRVIFRSRPGVEAKLASMIARVPSRRFTPGGEPDVQEDLDQDRGRLRPVGLAGVGAAEGLAGEVPLAVRDVLEARCLGCHDGASRKGGLDLSAPEPNFADAEGFARWVKVYDRVESGEMPPKRAGAADAPTSRGPSSAGSIGRLTDAEDARLAASGRSPRSAA